MIQVEKQEIKKLFVNPIITDPQYIGLSDGDVRVSELGTRILSVLNNSGLEFSQEVLGNFLYAIKSCKFLDLNEAIDHLYDYANSHEIWLGTANDTPADKILTN